MICKTLLVFAFLCIARCEQPHHPPPQNPQQPSHEHPEHSGGGHPPPPPLQQQVYIQQTTGGPVNNTGSQISYCEPDICPPVAIIALLILSEHYPDYGFETIQGVISDVVEECELAQSTRFAYTSGRESDLLWAVDEKSFNSLQRIVALRDFQWPKPPKPNELTYSIMQMIELLVAKDVMPQKSKKYILVLSNFDLYVDEKGADQIQIQLELNDIHFQIVELPTDTGSSESTEESANHVEISQIDPDILKFELENINELGSVTKNMTHCSVMRERLKLSGTSLKDDEDDDRITFYAVVIAAVMLVILVISVLTLLYIKSKLKWKTKISKFRAATNFSQSSAHEQKITLNEIMKVNNSDEWTLPREQLEILYDEKLGSGAFCCVYKGKLLGTAPVCKINPSVHTSRLYSNCDVAVKMLPPYTDDIAKSDFFQEMNFMKALNYHPHLVCLLATAWDQYEPCLVTEYCENGDLLHYVRRKKDEIKDIEGGPNHLRLKDLLCFAWQISDGIDYLSSKGCIHRDLAARNVLVDRSNTAKIGDFGLCRLIDSSLYSSRGGRLPIKWMAIESLQSYEYSAKSDVWSFGVLLFELFSLGDVPFPRVQPADMIEYLTAGNRLEQPDYCTDEIYAMMQSCWREAPDDRPSFAALRNKLAAVIESSSTDYGYLSLSDENNRRSLIVTTPDDTI